MNEPEEKTAPEIRGGDRPADYIPEVPVKDAGGFGLIGWESKVYRDVDGNEIPVDDEPLGGNDPEAQ